MKKRIAIKGAYGSGNFGDDALMYVVGNIAKKICDEDDLIFICNRTLPYVNVIFPKSTFITRVSRNMRADVLIYGGGTQFFSFPLTATTTRISKRLFENIFAPLDGVKKLINRVRYKSEVRMSSKMVALGVGVGPFVDGSLQQRQAYNLFKLLDSLSVRDSSSLEYCSEWGLTNVSLSSDLCFMTEYFRPMIDERANSNVIKKIGVIVRDWVHTDEGSKYIDRLPLLANKLRLLGYEVIFVSFQDIGDMAVIEKLRFHNEEIVRWDVSKDTIKDFVNKLNDFDAFFSARYHGAVFSAILGKPVVCIEVEQKLKLIADLLDEGAKCWSYPFNIDDAVMSLTELVDNVRHAKTSLRSAVDEQELLAKEMVDDFLTTYK